MELLAGMRPALFRMTDYPEHKHRPKYKLIEKTDFCRRQMWKESTHVKNGDKS